jgi:tetratricopeptide (TPR) repeat protein
LYELFSLRGRAAYLLGDVDDALDDFRMALHIKPGSIREELIKAEMFNLEQRDDLSLKILNRVLDSDQPSISAHFLKAKICHFHANNGFNSRQSHVDISHDYARLYAIAACNFNYNFSEFANAAKKYVSAETSQRVKEGVEALIKGDFESAGSLLSWVVNGSCYDIDSAAHYALGLVHYKLAVSQSPADLLRLGSAKEYVKQAVEIYPLEQKFVDAYHGISAMYELKSAAMKSNAGSLDVSPSIFITRKAKKIAINLEAKEITLSDGTSFFVTKN